MSDSRKYKGTRTHFPNSCYKNYLQAGKMKSFHLLFLGLCHVARQQALNSFCPISEARLLGVRFVLWGLQQSSALTPVFSTFCSVALWRLPASGILARSLTSSLMELCTLWITGGKKLNLTSAPECAAWKPCRPSCCIAGWLDAFLQSCCNLECAHEADSGTPASRHLFSTFNSSRMWIELSIILENKFLEHKRGCFCIICKAHTTR